MQKNSGTANEILGISPSQLTGYSVEQIAQFIRDVQNGMATSEPGMTEDEIQQAAKQIFIDAQEDEEN